MDFADGAAVAGGLAKLIEHHPSLQPEAQALARVDECAGWLAKFGACAGVADPTWGRLGGPRTDDADRVAHVVQELLAMRFDVACDRFAALGAQLIEFPKFSPATEVMFKLNNAWMALKTNLVSERCARL